MKRVHISETLSLPLDAVTQSIAILAKRRVGKSYTARRIAEQFLECDQQVVIVDPKGDWWGIRSSADGKSAGYPVVIMGGEHGDVPLEPQSGELIAKLIVEERISVLLDLSRFRKYELTQFMGGKFGDPREGFLEALYRLKAQERYRDAMMLITDEADAIAPQKPQKGEERMLGAMNDIVRRGGQRGIGSTVVTQRSAVLNKDVLTQSELLVVLRTIAPQDMDAIEAWIEKHGTKEKRDILMESLPSLPVGDAWFWSPGWPTEDGIFKRVHVSPITTFDSGATPKAGERRREPKTLADIDLKAITLQMAVTIERAKAEDPKELRKKIAELEEQLKAKPLIAPAQVVKELPVERLSKEFEKGVQAERKRIAGTVGALLRTVKSGVGKITQGLAEAGEIEMAIDHLAKSAPKLEPVPEVGHRPASIPVVREHRTTQHAESNGNGDLTGPERRILDAIAWMESIGVGEPEQTAVAFLAGYTVGGGGFNNPRGALRTGGHLDYVPGDKLRLTESGRALARFPEKVLDSAELQRRVLDRLPGPEQKILRVILEAYPQELRQEDCAAASGYTAGSGGFNNPRGRLRTLGLIDYPRPGYVKARDILFLN